MGKKKKKEYVKYLCRPPTPRRARHAEAGDRCARRLAAGATLGVGPVRCGRGLCSWEPLVFGASGVTGVAVSPSSGLVRGVERAGRGRGGPPLQPDRPRGGRGCCPPGAAEAEADGGGARARARLWLSHGDGHARPAGSERCCSKKNGPLQRRPCRAVRTARVPGAAAALGSPAAREVRARLCPGALSA